MLLTVNTAKVKEAPTKGIVYVLELQLEEHALVKIGVTNRPKVEDRVCEILTSIWKKYRIFPQCYVKRFSLFPDPFEIEAKLHEEFEEQRYATLHKFSGSTEVFLTDLHTVTALYDSLKG